MASLEVVDVACAHGRVADAIRKHRIAADVVACDPLLADTAAFCEAYGVSAEDSANTIVVVSKGGEPQQLAACLVLATTRLDVNGTVKRLFGAKKASFAPQELACERTGMEYGGVTAIGLPDEMRLWIDGEVLKRALIIVGGGNRLTKVRLGPAELLKLPGATVIEGLAQPSSDRS